MITAEPTCQDFGDRPGCLATPDPQYTMDFSDIGEGQVLWCSHCGPDAHALSILFESALNKGGPETLALFEKAISDAEAAVKSKIS